MPLNEQTAAINEMVVASRADAPPPTPATIREGYATLIGLVGKKEFSSKVEPIDVGGLDSLLFTPPECDDGLLVWFHGGGWVINSPELSSSEADRLAVAGRCRVLNVGYGLAPEHPMPGPQLDAIAAATWAIEHAAELGANPAKVAVGGDSAGGNLAAVAAQRVPGLRAQVLVYPGVDNRAQDRYDHDEGYMLDGATMRFFISTAAGDFDVNDPLVSPLLADREVLAATPPALVLTAEYDPLLDQSRKYSAALTHAGVAVTDVHFDDETHLFFSLTEVLDGARRAIEATGSFLREQFSS
jgi:acetyl esterase